MSRSGIIMAQTPRSPRKGQFSAQPKAVEDAFSAVSSLSQSQQKPRGRTLAEFKTHIHSDELPLYPAERMLLEACRVGGNAPISTKRPQKSDKSDRNTVRASFIRFLALGGDDQAPVHERGVKLQGAWIEGSLDLSFAKDVRRLELKDCYLEKKLNLRRSHLRSIILSGSEVPGIDGNGTHISGAIHLSRGFKSTSRVHFINAKIHGDVNCKGGSFTYDTQAKFNNEPRDEMAGQWTALVFAKSYIDGSVHLTKDHKSHGKEDFKSHGMVSFISATVTNNFFCRDATFSYPINENPKGIALNLKSIAITDEFSFKDIKAFQGQMSLEGAMIGALDDDLGAKENSWAKTGSYNLDGFEYAIIASKATHDANPRADWLKGHKSKTVKKEANSLPDSQSIHSESVVKNGFAPRPWAQLIKALRASGHYDDARRVGLKREQAMHEAHCYVGIQRFLHRAYGALAGYGYRPYRLLKWLFGTWLVFGFLFHMLAWHGVFAPSNPLVFQNKELEHCSPGFDEKRATTGKTKVGNWFWCRELQSEYTTFNPYMYSLDLILPLVDLQQDKDWAPYIQTPRKYDASKYWVTNLLADIFEFEAFSLNHFARFLVWIEIIFGWILSLMVVAVLSGIGKRSDDD
jgi:hypothetical protein